MSERAYTIIEYQKFRFSQVREALIESGKLAIFSRSRGGVKK